MRRVLPCLCLLSCACATLGGRPSEGSEEVPSEAERAAMKALGAKANGLIVWSSSRAGNHKLFSMKTDGSEVRALTRGDSVDWFPRFSPDGKRIVFTRSKRGWVAERDANRNLEWDVWIIGVDGSGERKVVSDASWGDWAGADRLVFSRATRIYARDVAGGDEVLLVDSAQVPALEGAELQQPQLSADGKFLALTLRGSRRETGIYNLAERTWVATGLGCQITWTPKGDRIVWVNPSGKGNSEVLNAAVQGGRLAGEPALEQMRFIDLPGRRSHEYFPKLSADGKWLVWAATQRGHDHDIADYEIFLWEVGTPADRAVRLTYHSGNDRWPDVMPGPAAP